MTASDPIPRPSPAAEAVRAPNPRVLVAIVGMNCERLIVDCIAAIGAGTLRPLGIVVVENGGPDAFRRLETALADAGLVSGPAEGGAAAVGSSQRLWRTEGATGSVLLIDPGANLGYAGGNNAAILQTALTGWDAVWILNPDTIPEPGALAALARRQFEGGYGMVGSRLIFAASGLVQTWGGLSWNLWLGRGRYLGYLRPADEQPDVADVERRITFVSGASMYVTRAYIDAVGCMDEVYFMYCEDLDWCLRGAAFRFGYAHGSVVRHIHGGTAGSSRVRTQRSPFSIYFGERNKVILARKHMGAAAPLVILIGLLATTETLVRGRSWRQFGTALRGWWAGVRGETGSRRPDFS
jgi:N-acetylglucosaminyl-diphospho-decaprenol L-rhamnosyltransferase